MFRYIVLFCFCCLNLFCVEDVYLKTPDLSIENKIGANVGVRPYRKTGVRLEVQQLGDKLIVHNYGYGGSGLTLSFGGSAEVVRLLNKHAPEFKVAAVLGAGVAGLATAYDLLQQGYEVHVYAQQWPPDVTSNVAAGIWTPLTYPELSEERQKWHDELANTSYERFLKSTTENPEFAGVFFRCLYYVGEQLKTRADREDVMVHFDNGVVKKGQRKEWLSLDGQLFMNDLYSKVQAGAYLEQKSFKSLEDVLALKETVIINCLSMGSAAVFNDNEFIPVQGHLVYFKPQEGVEWIVSACDDPNYFICLYPWSDRLIIGGVYEHGESKAVINPDIVDQLIHNAQRCFEN